MRASVGVDGVLRDDLANVRGLAGDIVAAQHGSGHDDKVPTGTHSPGRPRGDDRKPVVALGFNVLSIALATRSASGVAHRGSFGHPAVGLYVVTMSGISQLRASTTTFSRTPKAC